MEKSLLYRAYLIRLWPIKQGGQEGQRAFAQNIATGERKHFPDLESLFDFLRMQEQEAKDSSYSVPNLIDQGR